MIHYRVDIDDLHSHHFRVTLTVPRPAAQQELALPVWINGSYMVREFGRHLSAFQARQGRRAVPLRQLDKSRWLADCGTTRSGRAALVVQYRVYAFDTSVRAAFLDDRRGFFNGTSLCLRVVGQEAAPHRLQLGRLPPDWEAATTMAPAADGTPLAFDATGYDDLVDHPVELGSFWRGSFSAGGVPHHIVVAGALPGFDGDRLLADAQRICSAQIAFWHGDDGSAPPFGHYLFLLNAVDDGYGGLEHRASTALIAARRDLPRRGMDGIPDGYLTLLGLISHEYFHSWNVKRLKPADLATVDWQRENHTGLLWFFEGFTSYYDELMLLRCGLIDAPRYLRLLAKTVNAVATTPGRQVQSVAAASFDAWVKYYRPDENTPNATVSYYLKGALVALCFDLTLRQQGRSLDVVLRGLWKRSGGGPITEADIAEVLAQVAGRRLDAELQAWVHGTGELPVADLLATLGVRAQAERAGLAASLGLRLSEGPVSGVQVKHVLAGSAAAVAGLSAGDELLAIDGWRIRRLDDAQAWMQREQPFSMLLVRDQRVLTRVVQPQPASPLASTLALQLQDRPPRAVAARRRAWLDA
jgi:predicted metalloprotease with PDZ domain